MKRTLFRLWRIAKWVSIAGLNFIESKTVMASLNKNKYRRQAVSMSREVLAKMVSVPVSVLQDWEDGSATPSLAEASAWHSALRCAEHALRHNPVAKMRYAYAEKNWTLDKLSAASRVSRATCGRALQGKPVAWPQMLAVANTLGVKLQ